MEIFDDRHEAGRRLAPWVERFRAERPIVLGLARGGVPVAREVARTLHAPLSVLVVRKLGAPLQPELGMGALVEGGVRFVDRRVQQEVGTSEESLEAIAAREQAEIDRRVRRYRSGRPLLPVVGRTVLLVDDGIATGGTVRAAIRAMRSLGARRVVVVAPVVAADAAARIAQEADDLAFVQAPGDLWSIGLWYRDFRQVSDDEVAAELSAAELEQAASPPPSAGREAGASPPAGLEAGALPPRPSSGLAPDVTFDEVGHRLEGRLLVPPGARGIVLFAHGSGSSRHSPRNGHVARLLAAAGLGTLLFDLLTADEEARDAVDAHLRFDVPLLATRLAAATDWVRREPATADLAIGYFGASTGAAAALLAAARRTDVAAIVSRGGRPDLAGDALTQVWTPTLLIVGGDDEAVLALNRQALARLPGEKELAVIPGATHLFEEPGALDEVARRAARFFVRHLSTGPRELHA